MGKWTIFILSTLILFNFSCQKEEEDVTYLSHKLILEAQRASDYEIRFTWNSEIVSRYERLIFVKTYVEKGMDFYAELIQYCIDESSDYDFGWNECRLYYISTGESSYKIMDYNDDNNNYYYKLLAYNSYGDYICSNTIVSIK